jgi:hypothetical protein
MRRHETPGWLSGWLAAEHRLQRIIIIFPSSISSNGHINRGLGTMSGPLENEEKSNTEIRQPLKKLPILMWLLSTSQAHYQAFLKHL